jgi:hypothetical protein
VNLSGPANAEIADAQGDGRIYEFPPPSTAAEMTSLDCQAFEANR